jgi:hypothetical protein
MKEASPIERLRLIESNYPDTLICPNCLVSRTGAFVGKHASWCAIKRETATMELEASDYEIQI